MTDKPKEVLTDKQREINELVRRVQSGTITAVFRTLEEEGLIRFDPARNVYLNGHATVSGERLRKLVDDRMAHSDD